jgi:hypothetical protein
MEGSVLTSLVLTERVITPALTDVQNRRAEQLAWEFWDTYTPGNTVSQFCQLHESTDAKHLQEGVDEFIERHVKNFIQMALAWAGKTLNVAAIVGVPAGEAAEVAVDSFFAAESVVSVIQAIGDIRTAADEFAEFFHSFTSVTLADGSEGIYNKVLSIISKVAQLAKKAGLKLSEYLTKASKKISKIINSVAATVADGIATVIPIPGADAAIQEMFVQLSKKAFDAVSWVYNKIPESWQDLFVVPGLITEFLNEVIDLTIEFAEWTQKEGEAGKADTTLKKMAVGIFNSLPSPGIMKILAKQFEVADKIVLFLETTGREVAELMGELFVKVVPFFFAALAAYQIIVTGEWKEEGAVISRRAKQATKGIFREIAPSRPPVLTLTTRRLKQIIKEEIINLKNA